MINPEFRRFRYTYIAGEEKTNCQITVRWPCTGSRRVDYVVQISLDDYCINARYIILELSNTVNPHTWRYIVGSSSRLPP